MDYSMLLEKATSFIAPVFWAIVILIAGNVVVKISSKLVAKALIKLNVDEALHTFIKNVVKVVIWIIAIITALGTLGIPIATFVTVLGACGAAIALALKDSLGNVAGGIIVFINKPFKKGDFIDLNGVTGIVDKIDLLVTTLKTPDNKVITVPNGNVSTGVLINYSKEELRRVDCTFGIGYECSIHKAREVILAVVAGNSLIHQEPEPQVVVVNHGDSSIDMECRVWCDGKDYWDIKFFLEENVKIAFDEAGISIPFPQMDVHVIK